MLKNGLGLEVQITNKLDDFRESSLPRINYSGNEITGCLNVEPHIILSDFGIKDYSIEVINHQRYQKIFFKNDGEDIPFDLFGAAFWLLTRYEEYLPHKTDQFNRFHYKSSIAYQYDFIHLPLINIWLDELRDVLQRRYPELHVHSRKYNFISTIDVDNVFKYKLKGFARTVAGYVADMYNKNGEGIRERTSILLNRQKDPFDCYDFLIQTHERNSINTIFFWLLGDYGMNDKNHSANDLRFHSLIKHLNDYSSVGIHPSFGSNNNLQQLKIEVGRLANITHRQIGKSRQHFSMLKFPSTYQALLQAGISEDYSMGYTNKNGFRASYCYPYKWYSLEDEQETNLFIHPFCITENTINEVAKKENKDFLELAKPIVDCVKKFNGQLISVFHNDTFDERMKQNYICFITLAKPD